MAQKISSPRAELTVLRAVTHKNKKIAGAILGAVDETYFDNPESIELFQSMRKYISDTGETPTYRLMIDDPDLGEDARSFFRDSDPTVQSIEEATKAIRILNRYRQVRGLYKLAASIDQELQKGKIDLDAMMEDASNAVSSIRLSKSTKNAFTHFGKNNNSTELVKNLLYKESNDEVIPTGIKEFDRQSGGLLRGGLCTIGANSGGGKSLVGSTQMAINMATMGYKVVVVPLEMSDVEMTSRFVANLAKIDVTRILQKKLATGEKDRAFDIYEKWVKKIKKRGGRLTVFKPKEDLTIEELFGAVNSYECDVVMIDYISLLKGADSDDAWQKLGAMARTAKINAESTNRVNVLLCQVNEDGKIRYARAISEHSSNSMIWVTKKEEKEKEIGRITVEQPKSRNSRSFPFDIGVQWAYMSCVEVDQVDGVGDIPEPMENMAN